jgi:alpha-beta hydrolase superfamily lysophospholipase
LGFLQIRSNSLLSNPIDLQPIPIPGTNPALFFIGAIPEHAPKARLLILHGYGDHAGRHAHVLHWMADRGIAAYAPDFRGHGRSAGKPVAILKWDEYLDDLKAFLAIDQLADPSVPLFILGHSHGALIAAAAAMRGMFNQVRGVILIAPYFELIMPVPTSKKLLATITSVLWPTLPLKSGIAGPMLTRDPQMIEQSKDDPFVRGIATPRWFTQTLKVQSEVRSHAAQFSLPLLMLVPGDDTIANPRASIAFFDQCGSSDKTIQHYPAHRHELLRELDRESVFETILQWMTDRCAPNP